MRKSEPLKRLFLTRNALGAELLLEATQIYDDNYSDSDGRVQATFELVYLTGWSPHESQQKPLKPGSAKMRLADVLKTNEQKLKR